MNLRTRFSLLFSLFVFIILMICVFSIYILYDKYRKDLFNERLNDKAVKYLDISFDTSFRGKKPATVNQPVSTPTLTNEQVAIFNDTYQKLYASNDSFLNNIPEHYFTSAKNNKHFYFSDGRNEAVIHHINNPQYKGYIVISAFDLFGRKKLDNLRIIMICTLGGGLLLSGLFAFFYVKQIIKPLGQLTNQMQRITENNLEERIVVNEKNNELTHIALNFNDMLNRLENAFEMRKKFVQHASHELRTPLTSMLAQTEAAIDKELSPAESNLIFRSLREDQQHLIDLTNSLLLLSKYEKLPLLTNLALIRVDEILYEAIDTVKLLYPQSHITVNYTSMPENDSLLTVLGNQILLMSAMQNLVKNACHYSEDNEVIINIDAKPDGMILTFDNTGKQLSEEEMERLFIPFFRGENSIHKKGYGLGLSIVQRIINLHKGTIYYSPISERLNRFSVTFPKVKA